MADRNPGSGLPQYAAISLGDGWDGVFLCSPCLGDISECEIIPPSREQWRNWLLVLVQDHTHLAGARVLKTSTTVEVLETQLPQASGADRPVRVICKQAKVHGAKDAIAGLLRPTAARRNFDRARILHKAGIGTAIPLAYVQRRSPRASWLITEFLDGVIDLDAYVLTVLSRVGPVGNRSHRNQVIHALSHVFRGLERAGLYHRDMKASNILLAHARDEARPPRACIVDLDGLAARRPWRSPWKPIVRLASSLMLYPAIVRTDYVRFLREYLMAENKDWRVWRTRFLQLRKKAARYAQAAQKRKSDKLDGFTGDALSMS